MQKKDDNAKANKRHWDKMVRGGCGFTQPWLDIIRELIQKYINGRLYPALEPLINFFPLIFFSTSKIKTSSAWIPAAGNNRLCSD